MIKSFAFFKDHETALLLQTADIISTETTHRPVGTALHYTLPSRGIESQYILWLWSVPSTIKERRFNHSIYLSIPDAKRGYDSFNVRLTPRKKSTDFVLFC